MTITVIVGRDQVGPGVAARIFEPAQTYGTLLGPDLRARIVTEWALLHGSVIPTSPNQMVYRLSRHMLHGDAVWTWIGCYAQAHFPNNARGGTYIGCGVLEAQDMLDSDAALQYVLPVFHKLEEAKKPSTGILSASVFDFSESALGIERIALSTGDRCSRNSGLQPGKRKLFLDLHRVQDQAQFTAGLCRFFWDAQGRPEYSEYSELVIGNNSLLADRAQESRAFDVFTPDAWQHLISAGSSRRNQSLTRPERENSANDLPERVPSTSVAKPRPPDVLPTYEMGAMNDLLGGLQSDIRVVARKVEDMDRKLERNMMLPPAPPSQSAGRLAGENWLQLMSLSTLFLFGVAILFLMWDLRSFKQSSVSVCESPTAGLFASSSDEKHRVQAEVRCLEAEGDLLRARVLSLRESLNVSSASSRDEK